MTVEEGLRYEFRVFDRDLSAEARHLFEGTTSSQRSSGIEMYLVSRLTIDANVKVRDGALDLKTLEAREGLFELWRPAFCAELPVATDIFMEEVAPYLGVDITRPRRGSLTDDDLITLCEATPALAAVMVGKSRTKLTSGEVMAEFVELTIGRSAFHSIAVESQNLKDANEMLTTLGIAERFNESYPAFLQRLVFA